MCFWRLRHIRVWIDLPAAAGKHIKVSCQRSNPGSCWFQSLFPNRRAPINVLLCFHRWNRSWIYLMLGKTGLRMINWTSISFTLRFVTVIENDQLSSSHTRPGFWLWKSLSSSYSSGAHLPQLWWRWGQGSPLWQQYEGEKEKCQQQQRSQL